MKGICLKCGYKSKLAKDKTLINGKQLYKKICKTCDEEEKERTGVMTYDIQPRLQTQL